MDVTQGSVDKEAIVSWSLAQLLQKLYNHDGGTSPGGTEKMCRCGLAGLD